MPPVIVMPIKLIPSYILALRSIFFIMIFYNCSHLKDVYCYAENVPSTDSYAFYGSYPEYATLHVPAASVESYKATKPRSGFDKIVTLTE